MASLPVIVCRAVTRQHYAGAAANFAIVLIMCIPAVCALGVSLYLRRVRDPRFPHAASVPLRRLVRHRFVRSPDAELSGAPGLCVLSFCLNALSLFDFIDMLFVTHLLLMAGIAVAGTLPVREYRESKDKAPFTILLAFVILAAGGVSARLDGEPARHNRSGSRFKLSIARGMSYLRDTGGSLKSFSGWKYQAGQSMYANKKQIRK